MKVLVLYESASCSVVSDSATPWTVARQASLSMDFPGHNTGMDCHFLLQRNFPDSGIKSMSSVTSALLSHHGSLVLYTCKKFIEIYT